jgi:hypothetical protein
MTPKHQKVGGRFMRSWNGTPYEGETPLVRPEDPEWESPVVDCSCGVTVACTWEPATMQEVERLLTLSTQGHVTIHRQLREWCQEHDGWYLLLKWSEVSCRMPTEPEKRLMKRTRWLTEMSADALLDIPGRDPEEQRRLAELAAQYQASLSPEGPVMQRVFRTEDIKVDMPAYKALIEKGLRGTMDGTQRPVSIMEELVQYAGEGRWRFLLTWMEPKEIDYGQI